MRRFVVLCSVLAAALLFSLPQDAFPQAGGCVYGDSAATNSLIAELVAGEYHQFGSDTITWPHEFNLDANDDFKAFRQVFDMWLTNHPSGRFSTP